MPHGRVGRTGLGLRAMWPTALQLSLLRQSTLSQVPWPANRAMAGSAAPALAALSLLPVNFYIASPAASPGSFSPVAGLWTAAQGGGTGPSVGLCRLAVSGR